MGCYITVWKPGGISTELCPQPETPDEEAFGYDGRQSSGSDSCIYGIPGLLEKDGDEYK